MKKILQKNHNSLRDTSRPIKKDEFGKKELEKTLNDMKEALESQDDGVALAAPQIGVNQRIFIVSWKVFAAMDGIDLENEEKYKEAKGKYEYKVFINPRITSTSKDKIPMEEGCLSVRPYFGIVDRHKKCKIDAYNENGKKIERGASGLLSQIFQHEIDHLNGILFTDRARDLKKLEGYLENNGE